MLAIQEKLRDKIKEGWQVSEAAVQLFRGSMPNILALADFYSSLTVSSGTNRL